VREFADAADVSLEPAVAHEARGLRALGDFILEIENVGKLLGCENVVVVPVAWVVAAVLVDQCPRRAEVDPQPANGSVVVVVAEAAFRKQRYACWTEAWRQQVLSTKRERIGLEDVAIADREHEVRDRIPPEIGLGEAAIGYIAAFPSGGGTHRPFL